MFFFLTEQLRTDYGALHTRGRHNRMNELTLLGHLENIAERLGIELRYENLGISGIRSEGGYCRVADKQMILINRKDSPRRKINILAKSLNKVNLEGIFIPPGVRRIIENQVN
jgi:hypothetical protein